MCTTVYSSNIPRRVHASTQSTLNEHRAEEIPKIIFQQNIKTLQCTYFGEILSNVVQLERCFYVTTRQYMMLDDNLEQILWRTLQAAEYEWGILGANTPCEFLSSSIYK